MRKISAAVLCMFVLVGCAQGRGKVDDSERIAELIVDSEIPVLVDFWAAWCMPCRILDPIIESLEEEYRGRVLFIKIDVDIHRGIAQYFRVSAVPSVYLIDDKTVRMALPGVRDREAYRRALDEILRIAAERKSSAGNELCRNC